ncbi:hypothetical protein H5410_036320, partial [Solanum commersonii]
EPPLDYTWIEDEGENVIESTPTPTIVEKVIQKKRSTICSKKIQHPTPNVTSREEELKHNLLRYEVLKKTRVKKKLNELDTNEWVDRMNLRSYKCKIYRMGSRNIVQRLQSGLARIGSPCQVEVLDGVQITVISAKIAKLTHALATCETKRAAKKSIHKPLRKSKNKCSTSFIGLLRPILLKTPMTKKRQRTKCFYKRFVTCRTKGRVFSQGANQSPWHHRDKNQDWRDTEDNREIEIASGVIVITKEWEIDTTSKV